MDENQNDKNNEKEPVTRLKIPVEMIDNPLYVKKTPPLKKKVDKITRTLQIFLLVSWTMVSTAMLFVLAAKPTPNSVIAVIRGVQTEPLTTIWEAVYLNVAFYILIANIPICAAAAVITWRRDKRPSAKTVTFLVLGVLSAVMCAVLYYLW